MRERKGVRVRVTVRDKFRKGVRVRERERDTEWGEFVKVNRTSSKDHDIAIHGFARSQHNSLFLEINEDYCIGKQKDYCIGKQKKKKSKKKKYD